MLEEEWIALLLPHVKKLEISDHHVSEESNNKWHGMENNETGAFQTLISTN